MLHTTTNQLHSDTKFIQNNNQFQKKRLSSSELPENYKNTYNTLEKSYESRHSNIILIQLCNRCNLLTLQLMYNQINNEMIFIKQM